MAREDGATDGRRCGRRGLAAGEHSIECVGEVVACGGGTLGAEAEIAVVDAAMPEDGLVHCIALKDGGLGRDVDVRVGEEAGIGRDELGQGRGGILRLMSADGGEGVAGVGIDEPETDALRRELL